MFEIFFALGAGVISFLSPCVLPLIPGYIAYISGSTLDEILEKKNINLLPIILFTLGFSLVFIIFGAAASFIGQLLLKNSFELRIFAGIVIIVCFWMDTLYRTYSWFDFDICIYNRQPSKRCYAFEFLFYRLSFTICTLWIFNSKIYACFKKLKTKNGFNK